MLREQLTGTAAELAYYSLLSSMPCVAAFVGILGLLGSDPETTEAITTIVRGGASPEAASIAREAARAVVERTEASGIALGAGLLTTLWVASIYLTAFRRAAYRVHGSDPGSAWRARPFQVLIIFFSLLLLALVALGLTVTKRIVTEIGDALGAPDATVMVWSIGRWGLTLLVLITMISALYKLAPSEPGSRPRRFTLGSITALILWLVASVGFEVWVRKFSDYDATYGALAGAIAFAVWLWISNVALLFGMVFDIELAREAAAELDRASDLRGEL